MISGALEFHRVIALVLPGLAASSGVMKVGVREFAGVPHPIGPDHEVWVSCDAGLLASPQRQYESLRAIAPIWQCISTEGSPWVCIFGEIDRVLSFRFVHPSDFAQEVFELVCGCDFKRSDKKHSGSRIKARRKGAWVDKEDDEPWQDVVAIAFRTGLAKLFRGELFQAIYKLSLIREILCIQLARRRGWRPPIYMATFEIDLPECIDVVAATVPVSYDFDAIRDAYRATISVYRSLLYGAASYDRHMRLVTSLEHRLEEPLPRNYDRSATIAGLFGQIVRVAERTEGVVGVAVGGSWLGGRESGETGAFDIYSDLDIYVVVEDVPTSSGCRQFVYSIGDVGALQMSKTFYTMALLGEEQTKADFRFVTKESLRARWETPEILWERGCELSAVFASSNASPRFNQEQQPSIHWIDAMFGLAMVSTGTRIARERLLEATVNLEWMRVMLVGPLIAISRGLPSRGVRRLEARFPDDIAAMSRSVAGYGAATSRGALRSLAECYLKIRQSGAPSSDSRFETLTRWIAEYL